MDPTTVALVVAFLTAAPSIILAIAALIGVLRTGRDVADVKRDINGRFSQMLGEVERRARIEGLLEGKKLRRIDDPAPEANPAPLKEPPLS